MLLRRRKPTQQTLDEMAEETAQMWETSETRLGILFQRQGPSIAELFEQLCAKLGEMSPVHFGRERQ